MEAEIGQFALGLAFVLALVQAVAPLIGAHRADPALMAVGRAAALLQMAFVGTAFICLALAYGMLDFSVSLVAEHSHTTQPLIYRLAGTWGSHEGSMLLWVLILAIYGCGLVVFGGSLRQTLQARVLSVQGMIATAFLGFLILTSNPFARLDPAPLQGSELNPLLQDPGLVSHPPILYLGYVGFSVAFAFAIAALLEGKVDAGWARWVRPWVLAAWTCLTVGIALGSLWAYYELGWGGWWFWDPVENASLMPWLLGTALLHSSLVLERRGALVTWTILLSILTFSLSLIGTFLVRSGVLTSVHAFAVDPQRGTFILAIIALATGSALALFAWRAPAMRSGALFAAVSREGGITLNNLFLLTATATVFLGTFYPVFMDVLRGDKISVGPPYYQLTFVPLFAPLLVLAGVGPLLSWRRDDIRQALGRMVRPAAVALAVMIVIVVVFGPARALSAAGIGLGTWLAAAAATVIFRRLWAAGSFGRLFASTPLAVWGLVLAHAGLGMLVIGVTAVSAWQTSKVVRMSPGQSVELAGRHITLQDIRIVSGPNYEANQARFLVQGPTGETTLRSERRFYPSSQTQTTEAGIGAQVTGNTYIAIGEQADDGSLVVRLWDHPFVDWIWAGAFVMALGGGVSLADRRLRLGAATKPLPAAPASQAATA